MAEFNTIMADLKAKNYKPIYFLQGEEPYFIDCISQYIENNVLTADEKIFNQTVVYGKDTDINNVIMTARRYPAMAKYQVVVVKEAQDLKDIDTLAKYVEKPLKSTILVINYKYKALDKRKKICSQIEKLGVLFTSAKLYDNKIPEWINQHVKSLGLDIDSTASQLIAEYLGTNLSKVANELDKLAIVLPKGSKITTAEVQKNIGISKDYNVFELQNAIGQGDTLKAARITDHFAKNQKDNPIVLTISSLFGFFTKMLIYWQYNREDNNTLARAMGINPYLIKNYTLYSKRLPLSKVKNAISLLREYDLKSKGVNNASTDAGDLLKELVFKIMH